MVRKLYEFGIDSTLEWVLIFAIGASGLCFLGLAVMVTVSGYRKRKAGEVRKGDRSD